MRILFLSFYQRGTGTFQTTLVRENPDGYLDYFGNTYCRNYSDPCHMGVAYETVEIIQGVIGRIFGFGAVKVTGRGISDLLFKNINDPMDVKRKIESV